MKKLWYAIHDLLGFPAIVSFKDGTFGVRRFRFLIGFEFCDMHGNYDTRGRRTWWNTHKFAMEYGKGTLEQAATRLAEIQAGKRTPRKDWGRLISLQR